MTFQFSDFSVLTEYITQYMFGTPTVLGVFLLVSFLLYMTTNGVPLTLALTVVLPLGFAYQAAGWIGGSTALIGIILTVLGVVISNLLIRLYQR